MDDVFSAVSANLAKLGYDVHVFDTAESASAWIDSEIDGCSVGFGGSETLREMGLVYFDGGTSLRPVIGLTELGSHVATRLREIDMAIRTSEVPDAPVGIQSC